MSASDTHSASASASACGASCRTISAPVPAHGGALRSLCTDMLRFLLQFLDSRHDLIALGRSHRTFGRELLESTHLWPAHLAIIEIRTGEQLKMLVESKSGRRMNRIQLHLDRETNDTRTESCSAVQFISRLAELSSLTFLSLEMGAVPDGGSVASSYPSSSGSSTDPSSDSASDSSSSDARCLGTAVSSLFRSQVAASIATIKLATSLNNVQNTLIQDVLSELHALPSLSSLYLRFPEFDRSFDFTIIAACKSLRKLHLLFGRDRTWEEGGATDAMIAIKRRLDQNARNAAAASGDREAAKTEMSIRFGLLGKWWRWDLNLLSQSGIDFSVSQVAAFWTVPSASCRLPAPPVEGSFGLMGSHILPALRKLKQNEPELAIYLLTSYDATEEQEQDRREWEVNAAREQRRVTIGQGEEPPQSLDWEVAEASISSDSARVMLADPPSPPLSISSLLDREYDISLTDAFDSRSFHDLLIPISHLLSVASTLILPAWWWNMESQSEYWEASPLYILLSQQPMRRLVRIMVDGRGAPPDPKLESMWCNVLTALKASQLGKQFSEVEPVRLVQKRSNQQTTTIYDAFNECWDKN
jgi:hypothetical protein